MAWICDRNPVRAAPGLSAWHAGTDEIAKQIGDEMPCDSMRLPNQTMGQRMQEVRTAAQKIDQLLASRKIGVKVGPQGAIAFTGISERDRARMTDGCIYRRIMQSGSAASKMAIARAEQIAGRTVSKATVATGVHSHDGGASWHPRG